MQKKVKNNYIIAIILIALAAIFTLLVKIVDVQAIGPEGSSVGFAGINGYIHNMFGENSALYDITGKLGLIPIASVGVFFVVGIIMLIKAKGFAKLDKSILILAGFYVAVFAVYVLFEKVVINYRPVILDEGLEASYPSSHTVLACCLMSAAIIESGRLIKNNKVVLVIDIVCSFVAAAIVIGRFASGVHWLTDIVGGLIISAALIALFKAVLSSLDLKNEAKNSARHGA